MEIMTDEKIQENVLRVLTKIDRAALLAGRNPENVRLLVVTKKQPAKTVIAAIAGGVRLFGENYTDEAIPKILSIASRERLEWHMIGHVQSRKAKTVAEFFHTVESVDSIKIADRLNKMCIDLRRKMDVLLEINLSAEENKSGWHFENESNWEALLAELGQVAAFPHLKVKGLMTMPPLFDDSEEARPYFKQLIKLQGYLKEKIPQAGWDELSMGTSQDYEVAVTEGATIVRIGKAILGPRPE